MTWFDLAALALIALAVFDGARSGLAWAVLELGAIAAAALAARWLAPHSEQIVAKIVDLASEEDLHGASHAVVFTLLALATAGVLVLVHPASRRWRFSHDRWPGAVVGAMNGLLVALLVFAVVAWPRPRPSYEEALNQSRLVPVLRTVSESGLSALFPAHLPARLQQLRGP